MRPVLYILFSFLGFSLSMQAQSCKTTAKFIDSKTALLVTIKKDPTNAMVDLKRFIPTLFIDMPYATPHNFTKTVLYQHAVPCLRRDPANALKDIQAELRAHGLSLKIYDAFRPFSVSCKMWQLVHDTRYVADPVKGSNHNRGLAVDLTLVHLETGKELDMGTAFDSFTDSAHYTFTKLSAERLANRKLLKDIMDRHGFDSLPTEWWHYSWRTKEEYEVIDLDFDELSEVLRESR
jgi:D-alanyl-D-alanine dipeptidase